MISCCAEFSQREDTLLAWQPEGDGERIAGLSDTALLDQLVKRENTGVQVKVAATPNTSPSVLSVFLESQDHAIYADAAANSATTREALGRETRKAEAEWLRLVQAAANQVMRDGVYRRGKGEGWTPVGGPRAQVFYHHGRLPNQVCPRAWA